MTKKEEEIKRKLEELESTVLKETEDARAQTPAKAEKTTAVAAGESSSSIKNDLYYFAGIGLIVTGLLMLFQHVRVGSGFFSMLGLGNQGFGLLLVPLLVGLGWMFYDSKSKMGWMITALSCGLIFFAILSSLIMSFPSMTLLGVIMMLLPFAAGGAFLLKGMGGAKGVKETLSKREEELKLERKD